MRKFAICFALLTCGQNCCADENDDRAEEYVHNLRGLAGSVTRDETKTNRPIIAVDLICTVASDETLRVLVPRLKHIEKLNLDSTQITDAGLKELAALQTLTSLSFSGTQITDAGLKALSALKKLTDLHLAGTQVTDAGVKELAAIPNLAESRAGRHYHGCGNRTPGQAYQLGRARCSRRICFRRRHEIHRQTQKVDEIELRHVLVRPEDFGSECPRSRSL